MRSYHFVAEVAFKTLKMCERTIENETENLEFIPDHLKIRKMCKRAVEKYSYYLAFIPDRFKTQEMRNKAVQKRLCLLKYIPDLFVTQRQIKIWHDDAYYCNDDKLIESYEGHQKRKAQKSQIKKELIRIAWHPSRYCSWCMSEDEKRDIEKLWV